jgi:hypothetical protein
MMIRSVDRETGAFRTVAFAQSTIDGIIVVAVSKAVRRGGLRSIGNRGGISKTHVTDPS